MNKEVTSKRIAMGLLLEFSSARAIVQCVPTNDNSYTEAELVQLTDVECDDPENIQIRTSKSLTAKAYKCEVLLRNRRCQFEIWKQEPSESKLYTVQMPIRVIELRHSPRINLEEFAYPSEVRYAGGIFLGFAKDMSTDHVVIGAPTGAPTFESGQRVDVVVRSQMAGRDILFRKCEYIATNRIDSTERLVFRVIPSARSDYKERPQRYKTSPVTITYNGRDLHGLQINGEILVEDVSITGFQGRLVSEEKKKQPIFGLSLECKELDVSFCAVRSNGERFGFTILPSNSQGHNSWIEFIQRHNSRLRNEAISPEEIASLLLESNFLKTTRLEKFGNHLGKHLPFFSGLKNNSLVRRFVLGDTDIGVSRTVSLFRFSDHSWLIHEGAAGINQSEKMDYLYEDVLELVSDESKFLDESPRYLCAYYNPNVPVINQFWSQCFPKDAAIHLSALVYSISPTENRNTSGTRFQPLTDLNLEERIKFQSHFLLETLGLLDAFFTKFPNRSLSNILKSVGPSHKSSINILHYQDSNEPLGILYRISTFYGANASGVISSIFFFLKAGATFDELQLSKQAIRECPELLIGTNDVIIISNDKNIRLQDPAARKYCWMIADLEKYPHRKDK